MLFCQPCFYSVNKQVKEEEVDQKEDQDCGGKLVAVESGGREVDLDLSSIRQVLSKQPGPLVSSPPILPWQPCMHCQRHSHPQSL